MKFIIDEEKFKNNLNYTKKCIKRLFKLNNKGINISISNLSSSNQEIMYCLHALTISDIKERTIYMYEKFCDELDNIWKKTNPCDFCNKICSAGRNGDSKYSAPNGCCEKAFDLNFLKDGFFLTKQKLFRCPYLNETSGCTTQNSACKIFVCNYLKKNNLMKKIKPKEFIIFDIFFNRKQKLILTYNFFRTKEQLISKLLEKDNSPYFYYDSHMKYLIID